jgi:hypothetical protein
MKSKSNATQPIQPIAELDASELAAVQGGFFASFSDQMVERALSPIGDQLANYHLPNGIAQSYVVQAYREQGLMQGLQPESQGPTTRGFGGQPLVTDPLPELL